MSKFEFDIDYVTWVLEKSDIGFLTAAIDESSEVIIDLETTGLDEYATTGGERNGGVEARVSLASLTLPMSPDDDSPTTWVVPLSHPDSPFSGHWRDVLRRICQQILRSRKPINNQNMKFDSRWVYATTGVDLSALIVWDTRISSYLLDENSSTKLKERAPDTFGIPRWDDFDLSYPGASEDVPMFDLGVYAARDTYWTWALATVHRTQMFLTNDEDPPTTSDEIEDARLGMLATWVSMPTVATLTAIEQRGIQLDVGWVREELADHLAERDWLRISLAGRYPALDPADMSYAPTSHWFRDWAAAAVGAGDLRVAELTPAGKPKWSKGVLVRQARNGSDVAVDLLALRSHTKKIEYLRSWLGYVTPDSAIHAQYNPATVVTGRLSSSGPNMQQVTATLKPAFVPRPGYVLADLDYSQIELRTAAFVSRCLPMIEAFRRGDDLHNLLAARITGLPPTEVSPSDRQAGKSANFGLLFGMSAYGFRLYAEEVYDVSFTEKEAVAMHRAFFEMWVGMAEWHQKQAEKVHAHGQVVSPIGRVRRLPKVFSGDDSKVAAAERAAINAPVQGFASDLMQTAAARIEGNMPGVAPVSDVFIVATVHDSLVVEVPEDNWEAKVNECIDQMTLGVLDTLLRLGCRFDVPLAVEAKVGTRWGLSDVGTVLG